MTDQSTSAEQGEQDRLTGLEEELQDEVNARKQLINIAMQLNSTLNLQELLQVIMSSAADLLDAETSSLMLVDEETDELIIEVATGSPGSQVARRRVPAGAGIAGWTLQQREPAVIDDPDNDDRFYREVGAAIGFETRNLLAVPLLVKDRAIGVVEVINKRSERGFTPQDVELASALASLAAIAVDNASLYAQLADALVAARMSYRL